MFIIKVYSKFLIVLLLFLVIFIFSFTPFSLGVTSINVDGTDIDLSHIEHYEYVTIQIIPNSTNFYMCSYDTKPIFDGYYNEETDKLHYSVKDTSGTGVFMYQFCNFKKSGALVGTNNIYTSNYPIGGNYDLSKVIYSSFDLTDVDGNILFPKTALTLAQTLEMEKPVEKFQTMIVGIIPYLIAFLIGLVAFWKAWQLLFKELRKA